MSLRLLAVATALAALALPAMAAGATSSSKSGKRATHRQCHHRARCARVHVRPRRVAHRPLERLLSVVPGPSYAAPPAPDQPPPPAPDVPALPRFVSVAAREFSLTLSRPLVGAGQVTVELRNSGEDPHNLVVSPEGTHTPLVAFSPIESGRYSRLSVTLDPGRYQLWCSLEFHEAAGMSTTLRVQ
jgi:hypothetical protein